VSFAGLAQLNVPKMDSTTWMGLAIAVGATAFVYIRTRGKLKRDPLAKKGLDTKPRPYGLRPEEVEEQMRNVLVELSGMAREVSAQMETRSQKLLILTQQADQRIAELKTLLAEARQREADLQLMAERDARAFGGQGFGEPEFGRPTSMPLRHPPQPAPAAPPAPVNEILTDHPEVFALAGRGLNAQQIAERTGKHRGEVELILALGNAGRSLDAVRSQVG
jgi:hypothetical protein